MVIMIIYHMMTAFLASILMWNFAKSKSIQQAVLYAIVLIPFVLRVLHLK